MLSAYHTMLSAIPIQNSRLSNICNTDWVTLARMSLLTGILEVRKICDDCQASRTVHGLEWYVLMMLVAAVGVTGTGIVFPASSPGPFPTWLFLCPHQSDDPAPLLLPPAPESTQGLKTKTEFHSHSSFGLQGINPKALSC